MQKKHVGFFGGTFDPIHLGHLNLAVELQEKRGLDEVWFCPAALSPHKLSTTPISAEHRVKMLALALKPFPSFRLITTELERTGPSYTIDTLRELKAQEVETEFYLILSDEALKGFTQWRDPEHIVQLVPLLIGSRHLEWEPENGRESPELAAAIRRGWTKTSLFDVSATEIRKRLAEGLPCDHLLPKEVLDYIQENRLYCSLKTKK